MSESPVIYRVTLSRKCAKDLESIFEWLAEQNPRVAPRQIDSILKQIQGLELFPKRNKVCDSPRGVVYSLPVDPYIVYYRASEAGTVRVLRVRHGARKSLRRFE